MTTNFSALNVSPTGAPSGRPLPTIVGEIINVKDYGALGNGSADDTAAIQLAIDAAFGPASNPHGGLSTGYPLNRAVYFPNGTYNISAPLILTQVQGCRIFGAGKRATRIVNTATSGASFYGTVFKTQGLTFALIEHMTLVAAAPGAGTFNRGFDLAWDGTGSVSLHAITFRNVRFEGGDIGCGIGDGGFMGSEVLFVGCDFVSCTIGTKAFNQNALDMTLIGGSFQSCGTGIDCNSSSTYSYLSSVSFTGSTTCDVLFNSFDGMAVEGCTSTSALFLKLIGSVPIHTKACSYNPTSGAYSICQAFCILDGCLVTNAVMQGATGALTPNAVYLRGNNVPGNFISGSTNISGHVAENI